MSQITNTCPAGHAYPDAGPSCPECWAQQHAWWRCFQCSAVFSKFDYAKAHVHFRGDSYGAAPPECIAQRDRHIKDLQVKAGILRQTVESADNRVEELQLMLSDERAKALDARAALDSFGEEVYATLAGTPATRWVWNRIQRVLNILSVNATKCAASHVTECPDGAYCPVHGLYDRGEGAVMRRYVRRFGQEAWDILRGKRDGSKFRRRGIGASGGAKS